MNSSKLPTTHYPLITIVGPTASGKTAAAIKLAQKIGGEIICADSRTVYKHMDIGTAKPTEQEQKIVPHHLLDVVNPDEKFNVLRFKELAEQKIQEIIARNKYPLLVGGSGLFIDSVIFDYQFEGVVDEVLRNKLEQMSLEQLVDYSTTHKIPLNGINLKNKRHLVRAIERGGAVEHKKQLRENTAVLGLQKDKSELQQRIEKRVEEMFKNGFLEEVEYIKDKFGWENESMSGIGYRVAREYFEGRTTIEEVKHAFVARDKSLAKRQMTWFRRNEHIKWFTDESELIAEALKFAAKNSV